MSFRSPETPASVRAIAAGRALSFLGDEVALIAMLFRGRAELGHAGVALVLAAGMVPLLALAPVAGLLVDRVRARPLLVATCLVQGATCVGLAWSTTATLLPLVAILACGTAIASPAWQALVTVLVDDEQLPAAVGLLQSANAAAGVLGPFVGGLLLGTFGFHIPLILDAVTFGALACIPVVLRVDRVPERTGRGTTRSEALVGFARIARDPVLRALVVLATCLICTLGVVNVVELLFITGPLHAGPLGYGLLGSCMAVGMLAVGMSAGTISRRVPSPPKLFAAGCVGLCVTVGLLGLTFSLWQAASILLVTGAANGLVNISFGVLLTRRSPNEVRGRVFAAVQAAVGAAQISSMVIGGALLLAFAPRSIILGGAGASVIAVAAAIAPVLRADREDGSSATASPEVVAA